MGKFKRSKRVMIAGKSYQVSGVTGTLATAVRRRKTKKTKTGIRTTKVTSVATRRALAKKIQRREYN